MCPIGPQSYNKSLLEDLNTGEDANCSTSHVYSIRVMCRVFTTTPMLKDSITYQPVISTNNYYYTPTQTY